MVKEERSILEKTTRSQQAEQQMSQRILKHKQIFHIGKENEQGSQCEEQKALQTQIT